MTDQQNPPLPPSARQRLEQALLFLFMVAVMFSYPFMPNFDLDASWRMALGRFFLDHQQFGRDVVFTYGPLGFLMGKTYSGPLFWSLIAWQAVVSGVYAWLIQYWARRLTGGWARFFFYAFFLLFGLCYEDALHMLMMALVGFELLRRVDQPWHWSSNLMLLLLAVLGVAKFTNLMLAAIMVVTLATLALWRRRRGPAVRLLAWFGGGYLAGWILCGQNPLNLPAYFVNSLHVSRGYQEAMGIDTPSAPFWKALVILAVLAGYVLLNIFTRRDRAQGVAGGVMLSAFVFLNWKHGFVRADGHMVGFFYCALLPIVAYPVLLEDAAPFGSLKRWTLAGAGVLCLLGIRDTIPVLVDSALAICQNRVWSNIRQTAQLPRLRQDYDGVLARERMRYELPRVRTVIGRGSVDVIGHEQAIAIYNQFNYRPRPVFQSYSVYTPELARLNADFYRSDRAPDYVLLRIGSLDERLAAMDDADAIRVITQRYTYVLSEKSFQLWEKNRGAFVDTPPEWVARKDLAVEEPWSIKEHGRQPLWVQIDLRPSLLGRLRTFFYKPPILRLAILDSAGKSIAFRMPAPLGRAGFTINPIIDDQVAFTRFASSRADRLTEAITLTLAPGDRKYFAPTAQVALAKIKPTTASEGFFTNINRELFYMFKTAPVSYDINKPSNEQIQGQQVMVMHAPSEMVFDLPEGATEVTGQLGFLEGAYQNGNKTNGADFVITWSDGKNSAEVFRRFLNPLQNTKDRGLLPFRVDLKNFSGGRLYFRTLPGPYNDLGWDWTAWTAIEIK